MPDISQSDPADEPTDNPPPRKIGGRYVSAPPEPGPGTTPLLPRDEIGPIDAPEPLDDPGPADDFGPDIAPIDEPDVQREDQSIRDALGDVERRERELEAREAAERIDAERARTNRAVDAALERLERRERDREAAADAERADLGRGAARREAAILFQSAMFDVDTSDAERQEAARIQQKILAGDQLTDSDLRFFTAALDAAEENRTIEQAQRDDQLPSLALAMAPGAIGGGAVLTPKLTQRQAAALVALSAAGVVAATQRKQIEEVISKGFRPPIGNEPPTTKGFDRPADVEITSIEPRSNVPAAPPIDTPDFKITGQSIDTPSKSGTEVNDLVGGLGSLERGVEDGQTTGAEAVAEAERIVRDAMRIRAERAARYNDIKAAQKELEKQRTQETSDRLRGAMGDRARELAREAQQLEEEMETLDDAYDRAQALRQAQIAEASRVAVESSGFNADDQGELGYVGVDPDIDPLDTGLGDETAEISVPDPNEGLDQEIGSVNQEFPDDIGDALPQPAIDLEKIAQPEGPPLSLTRTRFDEAVQVDEAEQTETQEQTETGEAEETEQQDQTQVQDQTAVQEQTAEAEATQGFVSATHTFPGFPAAASAEAEASATAAANPAVTLTGVSAVSAANAAATVSTPVVKLPDGTTPRPLLPGEHVEIAQFRQGPETTKEVNLSRGTIRKVDESRSVVPKDAPVTDHRVVKLSPRPTRRRRYDIGSLIATIGPSGTMTFEEDTGQRNVIRDRRGDLGDGSSFNRLGP